MSSAASLYPVNPGDSTPPASGPSDPAAFRAIFEQHAGMVGRVLRGLGVSERYLDEAIQDVFMTVHARLPSFEGRSQLGTWICGIAYRVGANARRKELRALPIRPVDENLSSGETPADSIEGRETARAVELFMLGLREEMRDVFVLCLLEERPQAEVAELLGLNPNTLSSRIRLLRTALRSELMERSEAQR